MLTKQTMTEEELESLKQALTEEELRLLLGVVFNAGWSNRAKLEARMEEQIGEEVQEENPQVIAIRSRFMDLVSGVFAHRLMQGRCTTSLVLPQDLDNFVSSAIEDIVEIEINVDELGLSESIIETTLRLSPINLCGDYWRWVKTLLDFAAERGMLPIRSAAERGMLPIKLLVQNAKDEITRQMLTKDEFAVSSRLGMSTSSMDPDVVRNGMIQTLNGLKPDDKKRREVMKEIDEELMPRVHDDIARCEAVLTAWLDEEIDRIYGVA
jgi:hypothetical protein